MEHCEGCSASSFRRGFSLRSASQQWQHRESPVDSVWTGISKGFSLPSCWSVERLGRGISRGSLSFSLECSPKEGRGAARENLRRLFCERSGLCGGTGWRVVLLPCAVWLLVNHAAAAAAAPVRAAAADHMTASHWTVFVFRGGPISCAGSRPSFAEFLAPPQRIPLFLSLEGFRRLFSPSPPPPFSLSPSVFLRVRKSEFIGRL